MLDWTGFWGCSRRATDPAIAAVVAIVAIVAVATPRAEGKGKRGRFVGEVERHAVRLNNGQHIHLLTLFALCTIHDER